MNDIATVERETQEAVSEYRRELVERLNRIRRDQHLSGTAKERYASQARREAEERHAEI
jgi:hypothetical protein